MMGGDNREVGGSRRAGRLSALLLALASPALTSASSRDASQWLQAASDGDIAALEVAVSQLPSDWALLAQARMAAGNLDEATAIALAEQFLTLRDAADCDAVQAQAVIADAAFSSAHYAKASTAAQIHHALLERCNGDASAMEGAAMIEALAGRLADVAPQQTVSFIPASTPYARDKAGLPRSQVMINGQKQESVLDTGANLSVVSASTAERLGLRRLGAASVGSSSRARVPVEVAVADRLAIAGLVLEHVPFLVVEDAQLEIPLPGGYRIDAIIGFPVFRAMGRVRFNHDGTLLPELGNGETERGPNLFLAGSDLFVDAHVNGIRVPLHLDSGGNKSFLSQSFSAAHPQPLQGLEKAQQRLAGAGGASERDVVLWSQANVAVGDRAIVLPALPVVMRDPGKAHERGQGVLGNDVLNAFDHWTLDLKSMRLELGDLLNQ
ncbi:retropepsin-like domain-containing protein [Stenotrophomonas sp. ISL-67]|uniref:retropepsin-like aspartic protease n=1 Tax=Stenotrophomonas sp. ISL-67 TaxID=2819171 RepID=UPI001BEA1D7C|nr:retropepsin-like aspartic protease [Stenotrophomonas sp. ISL-67]MBT2766689.1 retropepsin-like domain-containing protein [Stenotrophomonas sp. ISL-67]